MAEKPGRPHEDLFYRIDDIRAVRRGDWKLAHGEANGAAPELFNLAADIGEAHGLTAA